MSSENVEQLYRRMDEIPDEFRSILGDKPDAATIKFRLLDEQWSLRYYAAWQVLSRMHADDPDLGDKIILHYNKTHKWYYKEWQYRGKDLVRNFGEICGCK